MIEVEKCDFKNEVCENGYINIYDTNPIEIKEEEDKDKKDGESDSKKRKIEKNPLMYIFIFFKNLFLIYSYNFK